MKFLIGFIIFWLICAVLTWCFSHFVNKELWRRPKDLIGMAIMGPTGLIAEIGIWLTDD